MTEKIAPGSEGWHPAPKRAESQATLSAIGDVTVAATEAVGRVAAAPRRTRWLPIFAFLIFTYLTGCLAAVYAHPSAPWVQAFAAPAVLALIAALTFWRRQVWKFRARAGRFKLIAKQAALNSLAHETASGLNAIRAAWLGLEDGGSLPSASPHHRQVEQSLRRVEAALEKAIRSTAGDHPPNPRTGSRSSGSKAA